MVVRLQLRALRYPLLRRLRATQQAATLSGASRDVYLPHVRLQARQFAVTAPQDHPEPRRPVHEPVHTPPLSWSLQKSVERMENELPTGRSNGFYSREVVNALNASDVRRAWIITETLHRRHPGQAILSQYAYNLLLRHHCKQQFTIANANLARTLAILDVMIDVGRVNQVSFQVVMAACSRARHLKSAKQVVEKMKESRFELDERIYGFLINCCARKQGLVGIANRYFDEMLNNGVEPTVLVINAMLRVYSRGSGRSKIMLELVQRAIEEFDVLPDNVTIRTVIYYLLDEGNVKGAVEFLHSIGGEYSLQVQRRVMNALIDACRQRGEWASAEDSFALLINSDKTFTDSKKDMVETTKLEELVARKDSAAAPVVWSLNERDTSQMTPTQQKAFRLARSQKESVERALKRVHSISSLTEESTVIAKLSVRSEGKLQVLDDMIRSGSARAVDFNAALSACGRDGLLDEAKSVLSRMKQYAEISSECLPTVWSYNALLNACAVGGEIHEIEAIVNEMTENNLLPDTVTMNTALKAHITSLANGAGGNRQERLNNVLQALSFFEWCTESQAINPVAATYYSLFRLFNVYHEGSNDSSKPTGTGDVSEDDEEFDENREVELNSWIVEFISTTCSDAPITSLDVGVFNAAFDYFYRHGDADGALALFNLMAKRGLPPDDSTLGLIFATCANSDQNEVGLKFLEHAMNQVDFKPSLNVLNGAIQMCANSNNPDGAVELFRAIESADAYGPTVDTYEQVVRAYARVGDIASAWGIANEMERSLNKVPTGIYNRVMQACAVAGSPERALEMLDRMRCSNGVAPPDVVSYNMALKAVVVSGVHEGEDDDDDEDEADLDENGSYRDLDREGNESTDENVEWNGKLESGDVKDQDTLEDDTDEGYELERRERSLWTRTIVVDLVEEMCRSRRSKPDEVTYERAIAACSAYEDPEGVVIIFDKLIGRKKGGKARVLKHHLVSDDSISGYLEACRSLKEKERVTEASSLLHQWHLASSQPLSLNVVTQLLDALEDIGEWRCAVRMIPEMQELFGVAPSVVLFNRAMQMCNSAGEHQLVAPIFVTMQDASAYLVFPDVESYIQRIYAEEQREDWVTATDLFVEMQKKCRSEDISHKQLQKIALGRYSLRQKNC